MTLLAVMSGNLTAQKESRRGICATARGGYQASDFSTRYFPNLRDSLVQAYPALKAAVPIASPINNYEAKCFASGVAIFLFPALKGAMSCCSRIPIFCI